MDDVIDVNEMARLARCSVDQVRHNLRAKRYPGTKEGRSWVSVRSVFLARLAELAAGNVAPLPPKTGRRKPLASIPQPIGQVATAQR